MSSFWHHSRHNRIAPGTILGTQTGNNFWHTKPVVTIGTTIREWFSAQYLVQQAGSSSRHNRAEVCCTFRSHLGSSLPPGDCAMQHDMVSATCPACQSSISVQLPLHDEQQQQQRRLQLLESQKTLLESMKTLDQGRDADRQGELAKAFQLYKVGLAMAIPNLKLWPVINPMIPLIDECRTLVWWTIGRSEKISAALAAWAAVTEHPVQMMIQAFKVAAQSSASSSSQHGVASGTEQREPAHPMPEMRQHPLQIAQQQAQQPQPVAKQHAHPDARVPLHQPWKQVGRVRVEGEKKEQQQQQQQQLQGHHQQQPQHQQLEDRRFGPRQPLERPPNRLLQVVQPTPVSKAIGVASEVAHKKQRVEMREEVEEERKEREVNPWAFLSRH